RVLQARGRFADQLIAVSIPERAVDLVKVDRVDDEERHRRREIEQRLEIFDQTMMVRQLRQRIVVGEMTDMVLRQAMLAPNARLLQLALDRRNQAANVALDDVVLRAELHELRRALLADRSGNDEERDIAIVLAYDL